jgi:outer membrane protein OmpA-like peptidoglycan-associated protein
MMALRFARPVLNNAANRIAVTTVIILAAVMVMPFSASAQRHAGSVSVDLSVLDTLGRPATVPQLLQPSVRSLMMPNTRQPSKRSFRQPALSQPRAKAAAVPGQIMLKPPSKMKRATPARRTTAKAAPRKLTRKPVVQRPRPPAPPKIAARPVAVPKAPAVPPPPPPTRSAAAPVAPPPPPAPPPAAPAIKPPPAQKAVSQPVTPAPKQTASLPPQTGPSGSLAAGQQFRLTFGAGNAAVENAAGTQLDNIAKSLKGNEALRLQLLAYSGGATQTPSQARRLSLSRALAVRSRLIKQGIRSTRIDVRALGNKSEGGPPDRVDVIVTAR